MSIEVKNRGDCDFITSMSPKGQVVISKDIRDRLGLKPKDKFVEKINGDKIILERIPSLVELGGTLAGMARKKTTKELMEMVDSGWNS